MKIFGLRTPIIHPGDNLVHILDSTITQQGLSLQNHDILVLAETAVATAQGRLCKLEDVTVSPKARKLAQRYEVEPPIAQIVLDEADEILGGVPHVILTIKDNILLANAGIDQSNAPIGYVVLLPRNSTEEAWRMKTELDEMTGYELGIIIADSRTQPLRLGTVGLALAVAGIEPIKDFRGTPDLFGRLLRITRSAIADNLASAAQLLMGEADEQTPAVLIRDAPVIFSDTHFSSTTLTLPRDECLYCAIFDAWKRFPNSPHAVNRTKR